MAEGHRRPIVAAIGGEGHFEASVAFGRAATRNGWILLTGGQVLPGNAVTITGEVKNGAMLGASEELSGQSRLIGILPSLSADWDFSLGNRRLFLHTGLPHYVRNVINGRTPDAVVAFGGSRGTLAEIAFAKAGGKPVIFAKDSVQLLSYKLKEHFEDSPSRDENVKTFFADPLNVYPTGSNLGGSANDLLFIVRNVLADAREEEDTSIALKDILNERRIANEPTGFPGLPENDAACQRFEAIVAEISR